MPAVFFTRDEALNEILDYITYDNNKRLHSALGYLSPMAYKKERYVNIA
jgi:transposase InsO family protein